MRRRFDLATLQKPGVYVVYHAALGNERRVNVDDFGYWRGWRGWGATRELS